MTKLNSYGENTVVESMAVAQPLHKTLPKIKMTILKDKHR